MPVLDLGEIGEAQIDATGAETTTTPSAGGREDARAELEPVPLVAGIVFFAFGLETTLHHIGNTLDTVPAVALCGGAALYLLGHIAFLLRSTGRVFRRRTLGALGLLALVAAAVVVPARVALALVALVCSSVVAYEAIRYRAHRVQVRHPELAR